MYIYVCLYVILYSLYVVIVRVDQYLTISYTITIICASFLLNMTSYDVIICLYAMPYLHVPT